MLPEGSRDSRRCSAPLCPSQHPPSPGWKTPGMVTPQPHPCIVSRGAIRWEDAACSPLLPQGLQPLWGWQRAIKRSWEAPAEPDLISITAAVLSP